MRGRGYWGGGWRLVCCSAVQCRKEINRRTYAYRTPFGVVLWMFSQRRQVFVLKSVNFDVCNFGARAILHSVIALVRPFQGACFSRFVVRMQCMYPPAKNGASL